MKGAAALQIEHPAPDMDVIGCERAVLGALVTGALGLRDVGDLGESFTVRDHVELLCVLVALLETRPSRRPGVRLTDAIRACEVCGRWGGGRALVGEDGRLRCLGYLPTLARMAPRRHEALAACATLRAEAVRRWDVERDREALGAAVAELVELEAGAFLAWARYSLALPLRRGGERPIYPEAIPDAVAQRGWLRSLLAGAPS